MKIHSLLFGFLILPAVLLPAGCRESAIEPEGPGKVVISVCLPEATKTTVGPSENGRRKVFWADGDCVSLGGTASAPLSGVAAGSTSATFTFDGQHTLPYDLLYPASYWKDASTVTIPAVLDYTAGAGVPVPMACRMTSEGAAQLGSLCPVIGLSVLASASAPGKTITSIVFKGGAGEQVSGDFTIDYAAGMLTGASSAPADQSLQISLSQALDPSVPVEILFPVPARTYASGFSVTLTDADGGSMTMVRKASATLDAGRLVLPAAFGYAPATDANAGELTIPDLEEETFTLERYNVQGRVTDSDGKPLSKVVVSDGVKCVRTDEDGNFYLMTDVGESKYIFVSTPSGYLPPMNGGVPVFYKEISSLRMSGGAYQCSFELTPVANPDNCTLYITADPQPRGRTATLDKVAYKSTTCVNDLYKELKEMSDKVTDRQIYGICLGDLVHETMSLLDDYEANMATVKYPTYNIIGNHDHNPNAADDAAGAADYEAHFGPTCYSFNIGNMHFVMLDDMVMYRTSSGLKGYNTGLTARDWKWLQADLSFIDRNTTLMVCSHAPMFRKVSGHEVWKDENTLYGEEYTKLIRSFKKVHNWAGHAHQTYNYNYTAAHANRNIEVHVLARSTGELWTNEYLSAGTPRGLTVVEVRNGDIKSWRFHPNKYQTGVFQGGSVAPVFSLREWTYKNYVATMKDGSVLDESYQMSMMPPGTYGDSYMYVNVFLWDSKWDDPYIIVNGSTRQMELVEDADRHDAADTQMRTYYKTYNTNLKNSSDYTESTTGYPNTLFRVSVPSTGTGTIVVEDRFGNEHRRKVSW